MEVKEPVLKYYPQMSADEYLDWERMQEYKNEFPSGEIVAVSGASISHNLINSNLLAETGIFLKGKSCKIFGSDLRAEVSAKESYFYPDITIVCGELKIAGDKDDMINNPAVIIEILSPSTEKYDAKRKKFFYMQMHSLQEYIMIDSTNVLIDLVRRKKDNTWENELIINKDSSLTIQTINLTIPLSEIYRDVKF